MIESHLFAHIHRSVMYPNYIKILFSLMTAFIIIVGSLINSFYKYLPVFVKQSFLYGKFAYQGSASFIEPIKVPKKWFRHFYIFSSILFTLLLILLIRVYVYNCDVPLYVLTVLTHAAGRYRQATVSQTSVLLASTLLAIQCYRRLYDTHCVSVFGSKSHMNLEHYLVGFVHYIGVTLAILAEAPAFTDVITRKPGLHLSELSVIDSIAALLFLWAWWHQYKATIILANLRKNSNGATVSEEYNLPKGDWFDYISSPHLVSEMLMYLSLTLILRGNTTWLYVLMWVLCNQTETALLSHWWYQNTFKDFPKDRKILIPFVY